MKQIGLFQRPDKYNIMNISSSPVLWASRCSFVLLGISVAVWGALIPYVTLHLQIGEGILGLLLLCVGFGGLCAMPFAGILASRFGCRRVLFYSILLNFFLLLCIPLISSIVLMGMCLFCMGAMSGVTDVVINIQAIFIEKGRQENILSGLHGMYSLGNIVGAMGMIGLLSLGIMPLYAVGVFVMMASLCVFFCLPYFLPYGSEGEGESVFVMPRGIVVLMGLLCFLLYMNEGVVLDWAAMFLTVERAVDPAQAPLAFALFSLTMTCGRLLGDKLARVFGAKKLLLYGVFLAMLGYGIVLITDTVALSLLGFACVGLGSANMVPQIFSLSAQQKAMPVHMAIAAVTTLGFTGLLVGPVLMGFVAELTSLATIFALTIVCLLFVAGAIPLLFRK